jgi:leader peptidase (prepilin peptidase)/N-methyltransferase
VFAVFFVINFVSPKAFGYGDVRLGGILGGYLGWFGWPYVVYGILGGLIVATVYSVFVLAVLRTGRKTAIPLGPMLLVGALIVLAGDLIPSVYR